MPAFISAAVMAAGAATIWFWPFHKIAEMDRSLVCWPEPQLVMARLRLSRLRTGATDWGLYQDGQNRRLFIELFSVPSWEQHLRQHQERRTGTDLRYHDAAAALSDLPPQTSHYLAADIHQ